MEKLKEMQDEFQNDIVSFIFGDMNFRMKSDLFEIQDLIEKYKQADSWN